MDDIKPVFRPLTPQEAAAERAVHAARQVIEIPTPFSPSLFVIERTGLD